MKQGELIRQGTVENLNSELKNKVWEIKLTYNDYQNVPSGILVSNIRKENNDVVLRVIGELEEIEQYKLPAKSVMEQCPELDDLYLHLFKE